MTHRKANIAQCLTFYVNLEAGGGRDASLGFENNVNRFVPSVSAFVRDGYRLRRLGMVNEKQCKHNSIVYALIDNTILTV